MLPQIVHAKITFDHTFIQRIDGKELEKLRKGEEFQFEAPRFVSKPSVAWLN